VLTVSLCHCLRAPRSVSLRRGEEVGLVELLSLYRCVTVSLYRCAALYMEDCIQYPLPLLVYPRLQIDSVAKVRDGRARSVGNDEREQTLNQLLTVSGPGTPAFNND